jgi:hypothetical protein
MPAASFTEKILLVTGSLQMLREAPKTPDFSDAAERQLNKFSRKSILRYIH